MRHTKFKGIRLKMNVTRSQSNIPILRAASGEFLPGDLLYRVVISSARSNGHNLVVEELHVPKGSWMTSCSFSMSLL